MDRFSFTVDNIGIGAYYVKYAAASEDGLQGHTTAA